MKVCRVAMLTVMTSTALLAPACAPGQSPLDSGSATPTVSEEPAAAPAAERRQRTRVAEQTFEVVNEYPHDASAFTQGLVMVDGALYEGTGRYGSSGVRRVDLATGRVQQETPLPRQLFGEGIAIMEGRVYQLTWKSGSGFVYTLDSLAPVGSFEYATEGWGLTHDGRHLIMSDGSAELFFLDPRSFERVDRIEVTDTSGPVRSLNELEVIDGEIWANVWQSDVIVRIDPRSGNVVGRIDMSGLYPERPASIDAVLNGIAYDAERKRVFVTGKLWSKLFEIRAVDR